ncbi:hypothetical protein C8J95_102375 [Elizabethkingia sp. YR214]|nr:hypothetical protein C8J95_102375 [Elizabethkingia sp. YR214]
MAKIDYAILYDNFIFFVLNIQYFYISLLGIINIFASSHFKY